MKNQKYRTIKSPEREIKIEIWLASNCIVL